MRKSLLAAALAIGTLIAPASHAALVTDWQWDVTSAWDTTQIAFTNAGANANATTTASELSWGAAGADYTNPNLTPENSRSALVISGNPASDPPLMLTNGPAVLTNIFTHYNNTISSTFDTLVSAVLDTTLVLQPNTPLGPVFPPDTISFQIRFIETLNQEPCFAGSVSICDDIFVIALGDLSQQFDYDGFTYQVDIVSPGNLIALSDAACTAAGAGLGCFGFTTEEEEFTAVQFAIQISTVPEPGVLALMGLGLLGLVASRRRRMI